MGRGVIVFSARIVKFVVESVVTGSAIGQSLLGSGKGVGQSSPFTVGIGPVTVVAGTIRCCVSLAASGMSCGCTVIMEVKDGAYEPTGPEDVMEV